MTSNESVEMENEPADDASVDSFELEDSNPLDVSAVLADEVQLRETATRSSSTTYPLITFRNHSNKQKRRSQHERRGIDRRGANGRG
jgi:hypothetical protein